MYYSYILWCGRYASLGQRSYIMFLLSRARSLSSLYDNCRKTLNLCQRHIRKLRRKTHTAGGFVGFTEVLELKT